MAPRRGEPADLLRPGGGAARRRIRLAGRQRRHRPGAAAPAVAQRAHDLRVRAGAPGRRARRGCAGRLRPGRPGRPLRRPRARRLLRQPRPRRERPRYHQGELRPRPRLAGRRQRAGGRRPGGRGRPGGRRGRHRPALLVRRAKASRWKAGTPTSPNPSRTAAPTATCTRWRRTWPRATSPATRRGTPGPPPSPATWSTCRPGPMPGGYPSTTTSTGSPSRTTTPIAPATRSGRPALPPAIPSNGPGCC